MEGYRRYCLADILPLGFRKIPGIDGKFWFIACLWGFRNKTEIKFKIQTMPITLPYSNKGREFNQNTQFQRIFKLFNGNQLVRGPLDYVHFCMTIRQELQENPKNFFISWLIKDKRHLVRWITMCESAVYKPTEFGWPAAWIKKSLECLRETPNISTSTRSSAFKPPRSASILLPPTPVEIRDDTKQAKELESEFKDFSIEEITDEL